MDTLEMNPKSNDVNNKKNESSAKSAKEIVMEYVDLITERQDFKSARSYLKDNESLHLPKLDIKKVFVDGDDVCILHETNLPRISSTVFTTLWFHVDGGKISSLRALFDPRPFIRPQR
jgi:hypothetical protein